MKKNTINKVRELNEMQCDLVFGGSKSSSPNRNVSHDLYSGKPLPVSTVPSRPKPDIITF